jgi:hypothetical protein
MCSLILDLHALFLNRGEREKSERSDVKHDGRAIFFCPISVIASAEFRGREVSMLMKCAVTLDTTLLTCTNGHSKNQPLRRKVMLVWTSQETASMES